MRFREGDFIENKDGLFFDVKGLIHPPNKVIAFVRYIPNHQGNRAKGRRKYRKIYNLSERYAFLKKNFPQYLVHDEVMDEVLSEVPLKHISRHYKPLLKTTQLLHKPNLDPIEQQTLDFIKLLNKLSRVSLNDIGVSGSVLIGLHSNKSDIDLTVYGSCNCVAIRETLKKLLLKGQEVRTYDLETYRERYETRCKSIPVSFDAYVFHESRKPFQGFFKGRDFFIRYIKAWNEVDEMYGGTIYKKVGYAKIKGRVIDDSDIFFTPCKYYLDDVKVIKGSVASVSEVSSFRGRFCEQVFRDEVVVAQGKVEKVSKPGETYHRLLLGNDPKDYLITLKGK